MPKATEGLVQLRFCVRHGYISCEVRRRIHIKPGRYVQKEVAKKQPLSV